MATSPSSPGLSSAPQLAFLASLALVVFACYPTIQALLEEWFTPVGHFSHGLLLLALGLWFVWEHRWHLQLRMAGVSIFGLTILFGASALWLAASIGNVLMVQYVALAGVILGLWLAIYTIDSFRHVLWRFAIVGLALPVWEVLNAPLQALSAYFVSKLLWLVDVPHYLEDTFVSLPNGDFEIAGGCSGLGFVMTGLSLAFYILATARVSLAKAGVVLVLSLAIALVTNWVRIAIIIYIGYATDMQSSIVADHLWVGWVCFAILAFPFFLWLSGKAEPVGVAVGQLQQTSSVLRALPTTAVLAAIFGITLTMYGLSVKDDSDADLQWQLQIASTNDAATLTPCADPAPVEWQPHFEAADAQSALTFCDAKSGGAVWFQAAYYASERQGKELIFYKNDPVGLPTEGLLKTIMTDDGTRNLYQAESASLVLQQWYLVEGRMMASERETKLRQILQGFVGGQGAYSVAVLAQCSNDDCESAKTRLANAAALLSVEAKASVDVEPVISKTRTTSGGNRI